LTSIGLKWHARHRTPDLRASLVDRRRLDTRQISTGSPLHSAIRYHGS